MVICNFLLPMTMNLKNWTRLLLATALLALTCPAPAAPDRMEDTLFAAPKVLQLKLELPQAALDSLRKDPKTYVKATLRDGDKAYANVGIRVKGSASVKLLDKKPSLAIKFNEFESGQSFYGHERINLNNCISDPSYLCEAVGGEAFRAAGVPAAKVTFATLNINGRDAGLYVLSQAANRDFLSDHFKKTKGNFYEGNEADITEKLRLDSGSVKDQADLKHLAAAARAVDQNQRLKELRGVLDMDSFVSFMAAEVFTWHNSGYTMDRNNYRIYHDPNSDRMVFIPDGLDDCFGSASGPLNVECKGMLAKAVLETGEGQRLFRERLTKLLAAGFKAEALHARINELAGKIRPAIARDANEAKAFDSAVAQLRENISQRARFLAEELKKK